MADTTNASKFPTAKRAVDIVFALVLFALTLPLFILATIGIKLSSKGPVLYAAKRVGKDRVSFSMYKFRTMRVHGGDGPVITAPGDKRIFKFGAFLRATKIDELPQLVNVLAGQVSFVGPRPEDPKIVERYYDDEMMRTLQWTPGLTSAGTLYFMKHFAANVDTNNSERSYAENLLGEKLKIDLEYAESATVGTDLRLIIATGAFVVSSVVGKLAGVSDHE